MGDPGLVDASQGPLVTGHSHTHHYHHHPATTLTELVMIIIMCILNRNTGAYSYLITGALA